MGQPEEISPLQRADARRLTARPKTAGRLLALASILLVSLLASITLLLAASPTAASPIAAVPAQAATATPKPACECESANTFCPVVEGFERCYTCSERVAGIRTQVPAGCNLSGASTKMGSCSVTENFVLVKDYLWTCAYRRLDTGCCRFAASCEDDYTEAECDAAGGLEWFKGEYCLDIQACGNSGCCKYKDGSCSSGLTSKACISDSRSIRWTTGPCPGPPECIPEPATILLAAGGFALAGRFLRRRAAVTEKR